MKVERGFRGKINDYLDINRPIQVKLTTNGNSTYDSCCFGVDKDDKLSDDRYMIFYNQTSSPAKEITFQTQSNNAMYKIELNRMPSEIVKLVFTVSIDGQGTMGQIQSHSIEISQNNQAILSAVLSGQDFQNEKAIIGVEIYQKSEWRISFVARGFNGGLAELLKAYGGELADEPVQTAPTPAVYTAPPASSKPSAPSAGKPAAENEIADKLMKKISLSKDKVNLEKHVVSLSKCVVDLRKKTGVDLGNVRAKVVVALDYSGSMGSLYRNGTVQRTIDRLVPLGLTFDDNGSIDMFLFQSDYRKTEDLDLSNYENYVNNVINRSGYSMGGTNYAPVLKAIIEGNTLYLGGFLGFGAEPYHTAPIVDNGDPTFILFITDGENADRSESDLIIRKSSGMNVFIQFIGIGNESFRYLRELDDMPGRKRDNTGFSKMADLDRVDDNKLYTEVLEQFSAWLKGLQ